MGLQIPKRIIQTDKTSNLSPVLRAATTSVRTLNPDFEYIFFDDRAVENFLSTEFPQYRRVIDSFKYRIQIFDLFRYLAVYRLGGFYLDTDLLLERGLHDLLDRGCVFPFEELSAQRFLDDEYGMDWEIGNYAFAAAPQHPFINSVIENCIKGQENPAWVQEMLNPIPRWFRDEFYVFDTTGPGLVTRTLAEYANAKDEVSVLFPEDVRDPSNWHCFGEYGVHLQHGSWRRSKGMIRRRLYRLWEARVREWRMSESSKRGPKRTLDFRGNVKRSRAIANSVS